MQLLDDVKNGLYHFYNEEGKLVIEENYKNGKKISGGIVNQVK